MFARDVELCLARLSDEHAEMITLVGLYDFSHDEVAEMLRCSRAFIRRSFSEALDALAEIFLRAGLLQEDHPDRRQHQMSGSALPVDVAGPPKKPPQSTRVAGTPQVRSPVVPECEPEFA